jgi:subfamily B ATP-binding cassette protein HlyB/CyaB
MGMEIDQQLVQNDCGISAVKTIYNLFNVSISRDYIKEKLPIDEKGVQFIDIKNFLNSHGFTSGFKLIDLDTNKDNINYLKGLVPFIATIKKRNELHYIIVSNITNSKVKILDPSEATSYYIGFQEFKSKIHLNHSYIKLLEIEEKLIFLINSELRKHGLEIEKALLTNDIAVLYNKVLYFSFLNDNYGFKSIDSERAFLQDLIFNLDISVIPKQFKNLKLKKEVLQIESPLILSVKKIENFEADSSSKSDDDSIYLKLYRSIKPSRRLWFIYIFAALFAATTAQLAVFINQILIDSVLPSFQLNILIVFTIGVGIFQLFDLIINQYKEFVAIHLSNTLDRFFLSVFDSKLNHLSISYIQSFKRGDLAERLSDSRQLKMFFVQFFTRILVDSTVAVYSLCILFVINWQLSIIVLLALILFYIWFKTITPFF